MRYVTRPLVNKSKKNYADRALHDDALQLRSRSIDSAGVAARPAARALARPEPHLGPRDEGPRGAGKDQLKRGEIRHLRNEARLCGHGW